MSDAGDETDEGADGDTDGSRPPGKGDRANVGTPNREEMLRRVRERAEQLRRREVETAIRKLEARGEVTEGQREAIDEMTEGIVEGLLSTPETAMREADERTLRAAMRVYGLDPDEE